VRQVFAFYREKEDNRVIVFLNLKKNKVALKAETENLAGEYINYFSGEKVTLSGSDSIRLEPFGYKVFVK
jgi:hypothetical protein